MDAFKCDNKGKHKINQAAIHEPDPIKTIKSIKALDLIRKDL